jgi:hypothetical protein
MEHGFNGLDTDLIYFKYQKLTRVQSIKSVFQKNI